MLNLKDFISKDNEILGGKIVFKGTRVPVESLFWHIKKGISVDEFIEEFDSVTKAQAISVLEIISNDMEKLYAFAA